MPMRTTAPTAHRTRSTSCCSAACCRPRWCPLFTKQAEDHDDEATSAVITVGDRRRHGADRRRGHRRAADLPDLLARRVRAGSTPPSTATSGTALARIFLIQIFFYGLTALGTARAQRPPQVLRRGVGAGAVERGRSSPALLFVPGTSHGATPQLSDVLTNSAAAVDARRSARRSASRSMALALVPALAQAGVTLQFNREPPPSGGPQLLTLSAWTLGYVGRQPGRDHRRQNLADPGSGHATPTPRRTSSSCCPTVCWRCRSPPRSSRRWPAAVRRRDKAGVHRPHVTRHPARSPC